VRGGGAGGALAGAFEGVELVVVHAGGFVGEGHVKILDFGLRILDCDGAALGWQTCQSALCDIG